MKYEIDIWNYLREQAENEFIIFNKMSFEEKIEALAELTKNLNGAIACIQKIKKVNNGK